MSTSRRDVLKMTGMALASSVLPSVTILHPYRASGGINSDTLKVGLIGCGGRGTGAATQALKADPNVVLHAMGDIFSDKMESSLTSLRKVHGDRVKVDEGHKFLGFDAYKKVLESGVDVVILATSPHFRPEHLMASVQAGKHIFCEKPMAVDAPGVRKVLDAARIAKEKRISLVSGFCWRFHEPKRAIFDKINDGAIGDVMTVYNTYNTGTVWSHARKPEWTDAEYIYRNWYYYTWLSGDHLVEQAIHSVDMMAWAFGDKLPLSVTGTGGRQVRVEPIYGNIYDHFALTYEYENGAKGFHFSRQQVNCDNSYLCEALGTKGRAEANVSRSLHEITGRKKWKYNGASNDMYQTEHDELFAAIRKDKPINQGEYMANSTLLGIMGRMAAYTGKRVTWDEAMNSNEKLGPDIYSFDAIPPIAEVARPGITSFS